jgi:AcrR family transcriptional regulator
MTGAEAVGVRKVRAAETEAALKEAAKRVFARTGYVKAKITDITAEAGRAAGSFYSHFAGKEALLEALLADMLAEGDQRVEESGHSPDFSDPAAVRWHVAVYVRFVGTHRAVMTALYQAAMVDERFADRLQRMLEPNVRDIAEHLGHVREAGGELPGDPVVVASAMIALMSEFARGWLLGDAGERLLGRRLSDEEVVDTITGLIVNGISGPRA